MASLIKSKASDDTDKVMTELHRVLDEWSPPSEPATKLGDHFWAEMGGKLVVMIHTKGGFYVCGGWECDIERGAFTVLEIIERPAGNTLELYY